MSDQNDNFYKWEKLGVYPIAKMKVASLEQVKEYYNAGRNIDKHGFQKSSETIQKELRELYGGDLEIEYVSRET